MLSSYLFSYWLPNSGKFFTDLTNKNKLNYLNRVFILSSSLETSE
uniref:Uncharacterized protein n=1 Tax=Heterorhabditis bacteriophora TaxID=37862 RepID=A0A1I7W7Q3_HETBA